MKRFFTWKDGIALGVFLVFISLLLSCGGSSDETSLYRADIPRPNILQQPSSDYKSVPGDENIYVGPYICSEYRISFDERLIKYNYVDAESYENYKDAQTTAMRAWNDVLGYDIFVPVADDTCVKTDINVRVDLDWYDPTKSGIRNPSATGGVTFYAKPNRSVCGCFVSLNPTASGNWIVIAHELGHCLGLDHNEENRDSLMSPYSSLNQNISLELIDLVNLYRDEDLFGPENVVTPLLEKCNNQ